MRKEDPRERVKAGEFITLDGLEVFSARYYFASKFVAGKLVLEVGCASGLGTAYLTERGAKKVIGGDISTEALRYAATSTYRNGDKIEFIALDATELPFRNKTFDLILALELIEHLDKPGSVPNVVEKGIGISYPVGKPNKKKGGYTDGERIPQGTEIDHVRAGVIAGRACRPTAGAVRPRGGQSAVDRSPGGRGD